VGTDPGKGRPNALDREYPFFRRAERGPGGGSGKGHKELKLSRQEPNLKQDWKKSQNGERTKLLEKRDIEHSLSKAHARPPKKPQFGFFSSCQVPADDKALANLVEKKTVRGYLHAAGASTFCGSLQKKATGRGCAVRSSECGGPGSLAFKKPTEDVKRVQGWGLSPAT